MPLCIFFLFHLQHTVHSHTEKHSLGSRQAVSPYSFLLTENLNSSWHAAICSSFSIILLFSSLECIICCPELPFVLPSIQFICLSSLPISVLKPLSISIPLVTPSHCMHRLGYRKDGSLLRCPW